MSLFSGKRRRSTGGVADKTPPAGWSAEPPHGEPRIDPLLTNDWEDAGAEAWTDSWSVESDESDEADEADEWAGESIAWDDESVSGEPAEQEQSWDDDAIDQDEDVARRRRAAPAAKPFDEMMTPEMLEIEDTLPAVALPSSFRPVGDVPASRARHSVGAGRFPDAAVVDHAIRSATRPYRLDPFIFDPSSILVERLGWYIDAVDVGASAGFEALVFGVSTRPGAGVQLIVPSAVDGWTFDSAVEQLADVQMRSSGSSDTAVGFDPEGHIVCVSLLQHVDVYAVRVMGSAQLAVAVEVADRYAQVIDDAL
ncbi:MAG: hypothetical protein AB7Q42_18820 [Acidimicrobiia bacterium]